MKVRRKFRLLDWSCWGLGFAVEHGGPGHWLFDLALGPLIQTFEVERYR